MSFVPFQTKRLTVRTFSINDLAGVHDALGSQNSGGRVFEKRTVSDAKGWLRNRMSEHRKLGFSVWAVEAHNGDFVGVCGLIPWEPAPMICYAVCISQQGKGYATEAAKAVVERGAERFGAVISTIRDTNLASIRVAEKIGMRTSDVSFSEDPALRSFVFP